MTPRHFIWSTRGILCNSEEEEINLWRTLRDLRTISDDLDLLSFRLFSLDHLSVFSKSDSLVEIKDVGLTNISANFIISLSGVIGSEAVIAYAAGPIAEPCMTLAVMLANLERNESNSVQLERSRRKLVSQL